MQYLHLLAEIKKTEQKYGGDLQPPCTDKQLEDLTREVSEKLNIKLPRPYAEFLELHNGLNSNGLFIYATEKVLISGTKDEYIYGFVEMNLNYRDVDYFNDLLVFGDGNSDIYVYQISTNQYQRRDRMPAENVIATYNTFEEMLTDAFSICL